MKSDIVTKVSDPVRFAAAAYKLALSFDDDDGGGLCFLQLSLKVEESGEKKAKISELATKEMEKTSDPKR